MSGAIAATSIPETVSISLSRGAAAIVTVTHRPDLPSLARTLPARFYTDPAHFARELETIHLAGWLWAGREERLAAAGDFFRVDVAGESAVILRDDDGAVRAFHNICRHRGTRLCPSSSGRLPGRFQCPYHGWTYRYDGTLASAPHMEGTRGFRPDDYPLRPIVVELWDGHVFVRFDDVGRDGGSALREHLDDLPALFSSWRMEELRGVHRQLYELRCNWKLVLQNYSECLHCPLLHPQLQRLSHFLSGQNAPPHAAYLGGRMELRDGVDSLTVDGTSPWRPLPGLSADERRRVYYYALLPNLLLNLHPDYMLTFALWPRAVDRTDVICEWHFHVDEVARAGFDPEPAISFWDETNRQDWEVSELAQEGIASRAYRRGPYSNREELLWALDRWIVERTEARAS